MQSPKETARRPKRDRGNRAQNNAPCCHPERSEGSSESRSRLRSLDIPTWDNAMSPRTRYRVPTALSECLSPGPRFQILLRSLPDLQAAVQDNVDRTHPLGCDGGRLVGFGTLLQGTQRGQQALAHGDDGAVGADEVLEGAVEDRPALVFLHRPVLRGDRPDAGVRRRTLGEAVNHVVVATVLHRFEAR